MSTVAPRTFSLFALFALVLVALGSPAAAQAPKKPKRYAPWTAPWIQHPTDTGDTEGVFLFRKTLELAAKPERFPVHVSADNRYRLFVNGVPVARGPARGDLLNWRYETLDLAAYLRSGNNVLSATVWNWGKLRPGAQISYRTGFLLQAAHPAAAAVNTGVSWKVTRNDAISFTPVTWPDNGGYYVAGPGEALNASKYPWGWQATGFDDSQWVAAKPVVVRPEVTQGAITRGSHEWGDGSEWQLVPRNIPAMEERPIRFASVRRTEGVAIPRNFLRGGGLTIPANRKVSILLDQGELTMGYPVLTVSGGANATATLTYAESLYDAKGNKGNRSEIQGKTIRGVRDRIQFDGGSQRTFEPLWLRTWRYIQLDIQTADQPLNIDDVRGIFTAYPFQQRAAFGSDQKWIDKVWEIDWRVFRLSAFETFWDTPYYEQLQYVGDTRIESLISLYNAGDDRLMRNAIEQFDASRIPEGITASRYPSGLPQYIPPFSLWWTAMVHDYWMHRDDPSFVKQFVPGIRGVLNWYERYVDASGLLGPMPWWNFLDWNDAFERGVAPGAEHGNSVALSLQLAYALRLAADIETAVGQPAEGARYLALAERLNAAARAHGWDAGRGLFADTPDKASFSQQTNTLAILSGAVPAAERRAVMERTLADKGLVQASYYFQFYVHEALRHSGMADQYLEQLGPWQKMISLGLTTTAETPEPTRSDSHAWSAHPNYHLLATLLGVRPAEPGFRSVTVEPALGQLKHASGRIPHPRGTIDVKLQRAGSTGLTGSIDLPPGVAGTFVWNGVSTPLKPGRNAIRR
jgi:hypothetical protein